MRNRKPFLINVKSPGNRMHSSTSNYAKMFTLLPWSIDNPAFQSDFYTITISSYGKMWKHLILCKSLSSSSTLCYEMFKFFISVDHRVLSITHDGADPF